MPKTRAQRRIDNNGSLARRNVTVLAGASSAVGAHTHDIYTTPDDVADLITTELTSLGLETAGTWTISGSVGYIDLVHAASDSTLQILNSDGTRKANLQVEGDLTVLGTVYGTGPLTGEEWLWSTTDNMYISANYASGPSTVQILNDSATYKASLFVEDAITTGGNITVGGVVIAPTLRYPDSSLYIEANNVLDSTVYVRNTDATAKASLSVEDDISAGGNIAATGNVSGVDGTFTGNAAVTGTLSVTGGVINDFYVDTNVLFVDVSENKVGINDSTPTYGLDVNGTFRATGAAQFDSTVAITDDLNVDSGALFVDASANRVGINDATPSYGLDVNGTFRTTGVATLDSNATVGGTLGVTGNVTASANLTVGVDLTVTDDATFNDTVTVVGDMTLPYWELDAATGTLQTTGDYAFFEPSATADYEGIRLMPSLGSIEAAYMSSSQFAAETIVFEQTAVNAGDLIIAKSGGKLRTATTFAFKRYLVDDAGNQIVDDDGNAIVMHDTEIETTIQLEHPPTGEHSLLMEGDQILIAGRPALSMWSYGTGMPFPPTRFFPAAVVSPSSTDMQIKLRCIVVSVSASDVNEYVVRVAPNQNVAYESLVFSAGSAVVSYGSSGEAYLSLQTRNRRAYMDIGTLPGTEWENNLTPFIRLGHIGGLINVADPDDVGLVGGDIYTGEGQWFRISEDGVRINNGDYVVTGDDGDGQLRISENGMDIRSYYSQIVDGEMTTSNPWYKSAINWVDDVSDVDQIYASIWAYRADYYLGGTKNYIRVQGNLADANEVTIKAEVPNASISLSANRYNSNAILDMRAYFASLVGNWTYVTGSEQLVLGGSVVVLSNIPTSSSGLPTGAIWNDSGTLKIVS